MQCQKNAIHLTIVNQLSADVRLMFIKKHMQHEQMDLSALCVLKLTSVYIAEASGTDSHSWM